MQGKCLTSSIVSVAPNYLHWARVGLSSKSIFTPEKSRLPLDSVLLIRNIQGQKPGAHTMHVKPYVPIPGLAPMVLPSLNPPNMVDVALKEKKTKILDQVRLT